MIDIKFIRKNPDIIRKAIKDRHIERGVDVDKLLKLDLSLQEVLKRLESLRRKRNEINHKIKIEKDAEKKKDFIKENTKLKPRAKELEDKYKELKEKIYELVSWIPNIPLNDVPVGEGEANNIEIKAWIPGIGYLNELDLAGADGSSAKMPKNPVHCNDGNSRYHWEVGKALDIIDIEAGGKVSGSRFYYIKNEGVLIIYAIFNLLMRKLLDEGFKPMIVPLLVRDRVLFGSSHFPADAKDVYRLDNFNVEEKNQLYLVGSSEPPLFGYFCDKTLDYKQLPIKVMSISTCFRSEAGSWGRDVRGIKRTHQFDKLEMDMIIENDLQKSREAQEYLLSINEWILQELQLPYHVINMCTGDLGYYAAAKKYDTEVWLSSQHEYMEIMSDSITTDYQSRRLNIRYKSKNGENKFVHTLNDTGATHRLLAAILDHYQQKDGSVIVPEVLREYTGFDVIKRK